MSLKQVFIIDVKFIESEIMQLVFFVYILDFYLKFH